MSRKMSKPKELIKLRQKPLRGGGASLYLDIYQDGRRAYEFLRLYLIPERSTLDKVQNRETLRTAQAIKAQRLVEMQNTVNGLSFRRMPRRTRRKERPLIGNGFATYSANMRPRPK